MGGHPSLTRFFDLYWLYRHFYGLRASRGEWLRAIREHEARSPRSRSVDEAKLARIARSYEEWRRRPNRYDLPGVDTPDVGLWRRHRLVEPAGRLDPGLAGMGEEARRAVELYLGAPILAGRIRLRAVRAETGWSGRYDRAAGEVALSMRYLGGWEAGAAHVLVHELVHAWALRPGVLGGPRSPAERGNLNEPATETAAVRVTALTRGRVPIVAYVEHIGRLAGKGDPVALAHRILAAAREGGDVAGLEDLLRHRIPVRVATPETGLPRDLQRLLRPAPLPGDYAARRGFEPFLAWLRALRSKGRRGGGR